MTKVSCPHDHLFYSSMTDVRVARDFFQRHLPENIRRSINLDQLSQYPHSFIDKDLNLTQSDILYQTEIAEKEAYLYLLCEHQSTPDSLMPFRLLKYCIGIWSNHLKQHQHKLDKLPLIIAMVFYNGKAPYVHSMDIKDLLDAPKEMIEEVWGKPFLLIDVSKIPDEELRKHQWSGVLEIFMKHAYARDFLPHLQQVAHLLRILESENAAEYVVSLLNYALSSTQITDFKAFTETVKTHLTLPTGEEIMTLAQQLIESGVSQGIEKGMQQGIQQGVQQGMQQGIQQGMQQGLQEGLYKGLHQGKLQGEHHLLIRLLKRKFSEVSKKYLSLIETAGEEDLLTWGERLIDASSLQEVFGC